MSVEVDKIPSAISPEKEGRRSVSKTSITRGARQEEDDDRDI